MEYMEGSRNWGRWPHSPAAGALNLVTEERRRLALSLARTGEVVSLARDAFVDRRAMGDPAPAVRRLDRVGGGGAAVDEFVVSCHGVAWTHLDALGHVWDETGMWEGHRPEMEVAPDGLRWGAIDSFAGGLVGRGVLLDVPGFRGTECVDVEMPVHRGELEEIAAAENVELRAGDFLIVFSGRDAWERVHNATYGASDERRPGLDVSCIEFIRSHDCSLLMWDMMDALPSRTSLPWPVHSVLYLYGVPLVDNASLEALASACRSNGRYQFLVIVAPLRLRGATGSPVNPLACL